MTALDTTRWYRHDPSSADYRPVVSEPDTFDCIPVATRSGYYKLVEAFDLTLLPQRHTVEWRAPQEGESSITAAGLIVVAKHDFITEAWVIVDDEVAS